MISIEDPFAMAYIAIARGSPCVAPSLGNIDIDFQTCTSLNKFKMYILFLIRPKAKAFFGIHDPTGLRYPYLLPVKLSPLRYHQKCHNFLLTLHLKFCECE